MRLRQELLAKGVDAERVTAAMLGLRGTELDRAREVWRRRFGALPASPQEHARHARFLAARGFGAEVIQQVLAGR
jgi:regulatory protein